MEASLSVQPQEEGASWIQSSSSRDDGSGGTRTRARPSWLHRALLWLLIWKHPAPAVETPALARARDERAPPETERPRWWSALARVACVCCLPVCSGVHDDDVVDPRNSGRRRRRRRRDICSGSARSPPLVAAPAGESDDDYWTFAFSGGRPSSLTEEMLMRRFVGEEDAMRRRMELQQAAGVPWSPPGPSRLSNMSLADDDDNGGPSRREQ